MNSVGCKRPRNGSYNRFAAKEFGGIFRLMRVIQRLFLWTVAILLFGVAPLCAEYTLILKNGRRITVQSYREEGGMIKFQGFGGEIGIAKDQIQSIEEAREGESRGMVVKKEQSPSPSPSAIEETVAEKKEGPAEPQEKPLTPEEKLAEARDKEDKEYQKKLKKLTQQIKAVRDRYSIATRGSAGPEPSVPTSEKDIKARTDELMSRLRDAQRARAESASTPSVQPPLPGYTKEQKRLSEMRNQMYQLEQERNRLIEEMKQKNFDAGSLFLE